MAISQHTNTSKAGAAGSKNSVAPVVAAKACSGCGACVVVCPNGSLEFNYGARYNFPRVEAGTCLNCGKCLKVCPGAFLLKGTNPGFRDEMNFSWPCYLIHSLDDAVRIDAASGGFITSMILHWLERGMVDGAIVVRCDGKDVLTAESFIATDKASVVAARGSKYAPVSSCTVLKEVLEKPGKYVFVGTPCMLEGLAKLEKEMPSLRGRVVLTIGFVCAGMASRLRTRRYIEEDGRVCLADVRRIAYRGQGWPGRFRVYGEGEAVLMDRPLINGSLPYVVAQDHYLRCYNCLDHWGYYADIVVSDPWCEELLLTETKGQSAIMVRTLRGSEAVDSLVRSGLVAWRRISAEEMRNYNRHLVIHSTHARHCWMALYQLLFFRRFRYLVSALRALIRNKFVGVRTTLRALNETEYYR